MTEGFQRNILKDLIEFHYEKADITYYAIADGLNSFVDGNSPDGGKYMIALNLLLKKKWVRAVNPDRMALQINFEYWDDINDFITPWWKDKKSWAKIAKWARGI